MGEITHTLDSLAAEHRAEKEARDYKEGRFRDFLKSFILDALHEEFHASLYELNVALYDLEYLTSRYKITQIDGIGVPLKVVARLMFSDIDVSVALKLVSEDEIRYERVGRFRASRISPTLSADSLGEILVLCQDRTAQQCDKEDERDAVFNILEEYPASIYLLKAFGAMLREYECYEERIDALTESQDRTAAASAASLGDLQTEIEQTNVMLSQERAGRQYAEDELYTERRKRERSR